MLCKLREYLNANSHSLWLLVGRAASTISNFLILPLSLSYIGVDRFNLWMVVASFLSFSSLVDLGIGNKFVNEVASLPDGRQRGVAWSVAVKSGTLLLITGGIGTLVAVVVLIAVLSSLNLDYGSNMFAVWVGLLLIVSSVTLVVFTLGEKFFQAVHSATTNGKMQLFTSGFLLFASYGIIHFDLGGSSLLAVVIMTPVLGRCILSLHAIRLIKPGSITSDGGGRFKMKSLLIGWQFLVLQLMAIAATNYDVAWLAYAGKIDEVGRYQILFRIIGALQIAQFFSAVDWPKYSAKLSENKRDEAYDIFLKSVRKSLVCGVVMALALCVGGRWVMEVLTHSKVQTPFGLLALFAIYLVVASYGSAASAILNTDRLLGLQVKIFLVCILSSWALKIGLVRHVDAYWMMAVNIFVFGGIYSIFSWLTIRNFLRD